MLGPIGPYIVPCRALFRALYIRDTPKDDNLGAPHEQHIKGPIRAILRPYIGPYLRPYLAALFFTSRDAMLIWSLTLGHSLQPEDSARTDNNVTV